MCARITVAWSAGLAAALLLVYSAYYAYQERSHDFVVKMFIIASGLLLSSPFIVTAYLCAARKIQQLKTSLAFFGALVALGGMLVLLSSFCTWHPISGQGVTLSAFNIALSLVQIALYIVSFYLAAVIFRVLNHLLSCFIVDSSLLENGKS